MTVATDVSAAPTPPAHAARELGDQWRSLPRAATAVAMLTAPAMFLWLYEHEGWEFRYALVVTVLEVAAFRGAVDLLFRRFISTPSLFGEESAELRAEDVVGRRRVAFWRTIWRLVRAFV